MVVNFKSWAVSESNSFFSDGTSFTETAFDGFLDLNLVFFESAWKREF